MVSCLVMVDSSGWSGLFSSVSIDLICGVAASLATLNACSTACLSGESCVGVCGEPCGVKVGDTASSSIRVACSTLCSMERGKVDCIADKSSGLSPAKLRRWSVIGTIGADRVEGQIRLILMYLCRFRSV